MAVEGCSLGSCVGSRSPGNILWDGDLHSKLHVCAGQERLEFPSLHPWPKRKAAAGKAPHEG